MATAPELKRYRRHLADELDSAAVYDTLAQAERDAARSRVYAELFNGRTAAFSALRQIVIGLVAAAFTAGAGRLLGVSIS